jgi:hypothetical protein
MKRALPIEETILQIDLKGCPPGSVLAPLEAPNAITRDYFADWETPLAPWGGFSLDSLLEVVEESGRAVLSINANTNGRVQERALVSCTADYRDGRLRASVEAIGAKAGPHMDNNEAQEALVGVVFRMVSSRWYYQFGIEGRRRVVLYCRRDDEWRLLASQDVVLTEAYLDLIVRLDGDAIACQCDALNIDFKVTDTTYKRGRVGIRGLGEARLASLTLAQTVSQQANDERYRAGFRAAVEVRGQEVPDPVLIHTLDHEGLGGAPRFMDIIEPGRYDMLIEGKTLRAALANGQTLWETDVPVQGVVFSKEHGAHGRLLYGFVGERARRQAASVIGQVGTQIIGDQICVIRASDGKMLAQAPVPPMHETARRPDFATTSGNFSGAGTDIVVREWRDDKEGGGVNLWAYNAALEPLWHREQTSAWYGHHWAVHFCDVDGDGRDELLAGGTMYDAQGRVLWVHDRDAQMLALYGARHYDAVAVGNLSADPELDPVAMLVSGSAGVYVVDALTGRTRAQHRVGHAQGCVIGNVRADLPGQEVLVATRWGNMGILTLLSGRGERLWTIQPDYIGQGATPVQWVGGEAQLIWTNTSAASQAFYNGYGERVKELTELSRLWGDRPRREVGGQALKMGSDAAEYMALSVEGKTYVFGPKV